MQRGLATAHAKILTHVLGFHSHDLGAHQPHRHSEAPSSLLRAIKLRYVVPALIHSQDSRVKRRVRFAFVKRGGIALNLPWLMEYTSRASTRLRGPTYESTYVDKYNKVSACRRSGGVSAVVRGIFAEPRAPDDEVTWERVKA